MRLRISSERFGSGISIQTRGVFLVAGMILGVSMRQGKNAGIFEDVDARRSVGEGEEEPVNQPIGNGGNLLR